MYLNQKRLVPIWRLLGMAPVSRDAAGHLKISGCLRLYTVLVFFLLTMGNLHYLYTGYIGYLLKDGVLRYPTGLAMRWAGQGILFVCVTACLLSTNMNCARMIGISNQLRNLDADLGVRRDNKVANVLINAGLGISFLYSAVHSIGLCIISDGAHALQYVPMYMNDFLVTGNGLYWMYIVLELKCRYGALNRQMAYTLRLTKLQQTGRGYVFLEEISGSRKSLPIHRLLDHFSRLGTATHAVTAACRWQLLAYVIHIVNQLIEILYDLLLMLLFLNNTNSVYFVYYASRALKLLLRIWQILCVMWPCSRTVDEANKTVQTVLNYSQWLDQRTKKKVFSFFLSTCKPEFNVCGLFKLNMATVTSIISAVTTYLVIVVQLEQAPKTLTIRG